MIGEFIVNGEVTDGRIPATDSSVVRGDGCFDVLRFYRGVPFEVDAHLDRLAVSAKGMDLELPPRADLLDWVNIAGKGSPDCLVRILLTRGSAIHGIAHEPLVIVYAQEVPQMADSPCLAPVSVPWHSAGEDWALASVKTLSYAPNVAMTRQARGLGCDDALMVSRDGHILEGPNFAAAWVVGGVIETPALRLGILDSITRRVALSLAVESGVETREGRWGLDRLEQASEVFVMSTVHEVASVGAVGDKSFRPGPVAALIAERFGELTSP